VSQAGAGRQTSEGRMASKDSLIVIITPDGVSQTCPRGGLRFRRAGNVQRARAAFAERGIPAIAIAGHPTVRFRRKPANSGNRKNPREQIPARKKAADAGPGVNSTPDAAAHVDGLHRAHSLIAIDLWEARYSSRIVQIQSFDSSSRVKVPQPCNAGTAEAAGTVIENSQIIHSGTLAGGLSPFYLIPFAWEMIPRDNWIRIDRRSH
jgi:hypothetical protein